MQWMKDKRSGFQAMVGIRTKEKAHYLFAQRERVKKEEGRRS